MGPTDCSGALENLGSAGNLAKTLQTMSVVRCDEAAWRFLGLSLAGYNALISLTLAAIAIWGVVMERRAPAEEYRLEPDSPNLNHAWPAVLHFGMLVPRKPGSTSPGSCASADHASNPP